MTCLRIHPAINVIPTRAGLLIRSDLATHQVTGADARAFLERLVPLLDGTRDRAAIQAALADRSPRSVAALLDDLLARGIVEPVGAREPAERGFLRAWPGDAEAMRDRLVSARVPVVGGVRWARTAARALAVSGVRVNDRPLDVGDAEATLVADPPVDLLIAALAPESSAAIERLARAAHRARVSSLWAHGAGERTVLGPFVVPGETACRLCAAAESVNPNIDGVARPAPPVSPTSMGDLVAMEAIKILTGYTPSRLGGRVQIEDLAGWTTSLHTLVRLPWCRVCGMS